MFAINPTIAVAARKRGRAGKMVGHLCKSELFFLPTILSNADLLKCLYLVHCNIYNYHTKGENKGWTAIISDK